MQNCPNCGQPTARTEDWVCQWCGYPLLSRAYRKIPKTYKQLQEERKPTVTMENEISPLLEEEAEPALSELPSEAEAETESEVESEIESEPELTPEYEPEASSEPEPVTELEPETGPTSEPEPEPELEPEPIPDAEQALTPEITLEPVAGETFEVTVEEISSAYQADRFAANAKFTNQVLRVNGEVLKAVVRDHLEIRYVILTGKNKKGAWSVRCTFSKERSAELKQLTPGQTVTIQGMYDGYERHILMRDCALI